MRRALFLLTLVAAIVFACAGVVLAQTGTPEGETTTKDNPPVPSSNTKDSSAPGKGDPGDGQILIKFKASASPEDEEATIKRKGDKPVKEIPQLNIRVVEISGDDEKTKAKKYKDEEGDVVEFAEPNGTYSIDVATDATTNDPNAGQQWQFNNTGQTGGTNGADMKSFPAWDAPYDSSNKVGIAILDTGIQGGTRGEHLDLQGKVAGSKNFTSSDPNAFADGHGHGTHVAGSAAASSNNNLGVAGACGSWNCVLYNGKVLNDSGSGAWDWIAAGISWAADQQDVKVISMSLGGTTSSQSVKDAITYAQGKSKVVVAAAGNSNTSSPHYPGYDADIAVGATDHFDKKASYSNYGSWVDVAAPGSSIYSTALGGGYTTLSGTSMATPHVAGEAALIWAAKDSSSASLCSTNTCVIQKIKANLGEQTSNRSVLDSTGPSWRDGRINACKAVGGTSCNSWPDTYGPVVASVNPTDKKTGVAAGANIKATFSEAVNGSTVTRDTFMLAKGDSNTPPAPPTGDTKFLLTGTTVSYDPGTKVATLDPGGSTASKLPKCTWYTAKVTTGIQDQANPPNSAVEKVWSFKTNCG